MRFSDDHSPQGLLGTALYLSPVTLCGHSSACIRRVICHGIDLHSFIRFPIGSPTMQVLDSGVTRLLVHRLVRIFLSICEGYYPLCETISATTRVANKRI